MIAGLLHDIGHGPLSHLFDEFVISENIPEREHEYRSGLILEQIVKFKLGSWAWATARSQASPARREN